MILFLNAYFFSFDVSHISAVTVFFFNVLAPAEYYTYCHTLSLHDSLPISLLVLGPIKHLDLECEVGLVELVLVVGLDDDEPRIGEPRRGVQILHVRRDPPTRIGDAINRDRAAGLLERSQIYAIRAGADGKSVGEGTSVCGRVDLCGCRTIQKKTNRRLRV